MTPIDGMGTLVFVLFTSVCFMTILWAILTSGPIEKGGTNPYNPLRDTNTQRPRPHPLHSERRYKGGYQPTEATPRNMRPPPGGTAVTRPKED